ncbi:MAG: PadR family transcriptional regulator, partial [Actinomycetia bacterium]|nr:PadR family transcriptional regulator [Actinomycetes bacterium]
LLALTDGPRHGYGIAQRAAELSEDRVKLTAGTLYGALDRLVGSAQITVDREDTVNGRRRRYYRLTEGGRRALVDETVRLRATVTAAERLIGPEVGGAQA